MLFNTVLDAIETILKTDADTKDVIELYRHYVFEKGIRATPFCLVGSTIRATPAHYDVAGGLQTWDGDLSVMVLGQAYTGVPARHQAMIDTLDQLQSDVFGALAADVTLGGSVIESRIDEIIPATVDEYFGFEIKLSILKNE